MECGIVLENYPDVKEGDVIEVYEIKQVEQTLALSLRLRPRDPPALPARTAASRASGRSCSSLKAQLQRRFGAAVAETDHHELWQRSTLTAALVGRDAGSLRDRAAERRSATSMSMFPDGASRGMPRGV